MPRPSSGAHADVRGRSSSFDEGSIFHLAGPAEPLSRVPLREVVAQCLEDWGMCACEKVRSLLGVSAWASRETHRS